MAEVSIIIPVKNIEKEIPGILRSLIAQVEGLEAEFIVVDMGSADETVLESVQMIKEYQLRGCVVQNGNGTVSSALNTGLQKAGGDYITFIFARRLYRDFIKGYHDTAVKTGADFVFGSVSELSAKQAERRTIHSSVVKKPAGADFVTDILNGTLYVDISAVMVSRRFLLERHIRFTDECANGYAEEFVYRCLLCSTNAVQSPTILKRDDVFELKRGKQANIGKAIFQHVEAMRRIEDIIRTDYRDNAELNQIFTGDKLPKTVLYCVDVLLREGSGNSSIQRCLKLRGYDKLLASSKITDPALKRKIFLWRRVPWMYKPGK